jgi:Mg-chelatase subunit ChlD
VSDERLRRWRLVLGSGDAEGTGVDLEGVDLRRDETLDALYGEPRSGGLGRSSPRVARWLGDIRTYFPTSVVQVMQRDAMDRLGLRELLLEPEMLESVEPDVHLVATLVALNQAIPERSRDTARAVVRRVTDELEERLATAVRQAVTGALDRSRRTTRPRPADIDWRATIAANLRHYQPELGTVVPERLVGHGRRSRSVQREIILAIDQSGSMASSVVYASVFGAVLASLRALSVRVVAFDTSVVDLTDEVHDPVDLLFGVQLGGGTDIAAAVAYCETLVTRPRDTVLVVVTDLFEGGDRDDLVRRLASLTHAGVTVITLLALSDDGAPAFDHDLAATLAAIGVPAFACTPDRFAEMMAAAVDHRDVAQWAGRAGLVTAVPDDRG